MINWHTVSIFFIIGLIFGLVFIIFGEEISYKEYYRELRIKHSKLSAAILAFGRIVLWVIWIGICFAGIYILFDGSCNNSNSYNDDSEEEYIIEDGHRPDRF